MRSVFLVFILLWNVTVSAQSTSTIKEYKKVFTTYPFSDPDPIPSQTAIYPYFRYDGFTNTAQQKEWKVVELENDFIKVMILPEIGGKIWTAIEKSSGEPFIYYNHVVKFRDVAMRGPWTSGGLEPNYGIIGHTPNCATPVDYVLRTNTDRSVSCFIGVLDLLTRTRWQMEINLPHDKAYFTTSSFWYNPTSIEQPYYHWMNMGIKVKGNLEFIYPGTHYIGHAGENDEWPVNRENGKKINFYEQNDFGTYKSYHVFGKYADFFGAYWHDDQSGMVRYSPQDEKPGRKIWIWGLSRQGMIWEKILTDNDGQYAEIQSGRLYNQNAEQSSFTPFKHRGFAPQATDRWTEYWYPVRKTRGMQMADAHTAVNMIRENGWIKWFISPVQSFKDEIRIFENGKELVRKNIEALPMVTIRDSVRATNETAVFGFSIPGLFLEWSSDPGFNSLDRPREMPDNFDWNSSYGLFVQGKELMDQKLFSTAEDKLSLSIKKDSNFLPALVKLAELQIRNGRYSLAYNIARKALSVDIHDGGANYYFGIAALRNGDKTNGKDGLSVATLDPGYREAAYTELARFYCIEHDWTRVIQYANKAIDYNRHAVSAQEIKILALRKSGQTAAAQALLKETLLIQPLNPFLQIEAGFLQNTKPSPELFNKAELPEEIWYEVAAAYQERGCIEEVFTCLDAVGERSLALYWQAYLLGTQQKDYKELLNRANNLSVSAVFPFRVEMMPMFKWIGSVTDHWKPKYLLALLLNDKNDRASAKKMLDQLAQIPDFAPFYALRALWNTKNGMAIKSDLQKAMQLDPKGWRYPKLLSQQLIMEKNYTEALAVTSDYTKKYPGNFVMEMLHAKTLLLNKQYTACDALLAKMDIIPFEGATDGRGLYWEAKLMQALEQIEKNQYKKALGFIDMATQWPENLGVGKPYDSDIDSRLENWLRYESFKKLNRSKEAKAELEKILQFRPGIYNTVRNFQPANHLVSIWAFIEAGKAKEGLEWFEAEKKKYPEINLFKWVSGLVYDQPIENDSDDAGVRVLERIMKNRR